MKPLLKILLASSAPAFALSTSLQAQPSPAPPATQPATQPLVAQSSVPLVIPDGTSLADPGPRFHPNESPEPLMPVGVDINGLRG